MESRYVLLPAEIDVRSHVGGKAHALATLDQTGLPVPPWFVVLPEAFTIGARQGIARLSHTGLSDESGTVVESVELAPHAKTEISAALTLLGLEGKYAVRSSALQEDSASLSFAGQLESFLHVAAPQVEAQVAAVGRSGFNQRVLAYRGRVGLDPVGAIPAVIVQRMVEGDASGVAFSADPVSGRRGIAVVAAVRGLGDALVSGARTGDTWRVDRAETILERSIGEHTLEPCVPRRVTREEPLGTGPSDQRCSGAIDDAKVLAVARLARRAEAVFERPQDIEWTYADGKLWLLQSRPITTLATKQDPDAPAMLWDNANIIESYPGVTTPLTFSFARRAYENVYREFCRLVGVAEPVLEAHRATFASMLGIIEGRVYYNLQNWYRTIALLPGYAANRRFLDQMLGVRGTAGGASFPVPADPAARLSVRDRVRFLKMMLTLGIRLLTLRSRIERFYVRLRAALGESRPDLSSWRPDELVSHYRSLERELLVHWDAPVLNDFATMIYHGLLRRLAAQWVGDVAGTLANDLLLADAGMISEEPALRVREMARIAARDPRLMQTLCNADSSAVRAALRRAPDLDRAFADYLARFGDRCMEELKLESMTLHDDPLPLWRAVGQYARMLEPRVVNTESQASVIRDAARERVERALARRPVRRLAFRWILGNAATCMRARENLRFERTRVFGRARQIFVELGKRLMAIDRLDTARDVFYLEQDELIGSIEGWATTADLRSLVTTRKNEFAAYRSRPPLPDRFQTCGFLSISRGCITEDSGAAVATGARLQGQGCCAGIVRGPVRVVADPRRASVRPGEIIVAERTDPGWVMIFPSASGLLVERGSLLSHSAIVARELNLPTIVAIRGLTQWVSDGDWVEMDGASGWVSKIAPVPQTSADALA